MADGKLATSGSAKIPLARSQKTAPILLNNKQQTTRLSESSIGTDDAMQCNAIDRASQRARRIPAIVCLRA